MVDDSIEGSSRSPFEVPKDIQQKFIQEADILAHKIPYVQQYRLEPQHLLLVSEEEKRLGRVHRRYYGKATSDFPDLETSFRMYESLILEKDSTGTYRLRGISRYQEGRGSESLVRHPGEVISVLMGRSHSSVPLGMRYKESGGRALLTHIQNDYGILLESWVVDINDQRLQRGEVVAPERSAGQRQIQLTENKDAAVVTLFAETPLGQSFNDTIIVPREVDFASVVTRLIPQDLAADPYNADSSLDRAWREQSPLRLMGIQEV